MAVTERGQYAMAREIAKRIAPQIAAEACGRVCGDCTHAIYGETLGVCTKHVNAFTGEQLLIVRRNAVACRDWLGGDC